MLRPPIRKRKDAIDAPRGTLGLSLPDLPFGNDGVEWTDEGCIGLREGGNGESGDTMSEDASRLHWTLTLPSHGCGAVAPRRLPAAPAGPDYTQSGIRAVPAETGARRSSDDQAVVEITREVMNRVISARYVPHRALLRAEELGPSPPSGP